MKEHLTFVGQIKGQKSPTHFPAVGDSNEAVLKESDLSEVSTMGSYGLQQSTLSVTEDSQWDTDWLYCQTLLLFKQVQVMMVLCCCNLYYFFTSAGKGLWSMQECGLCANVTVGQEARMSQQIVNTDEQHACLEPAETDIGSLSLAFTQVFRRKPNSLITPVADTVTFQIFSRP
ncbi:hypothetical protein PAMP_018776 [Pampus punctatissimus]